MSFTPMSVFEAQKVKAAKKQAALILADNFFTFSFAFILCALPCFAVFSLSKLTLLFFSDKILLYFFFPLSCAFALRGYHAFVGEFFKTGKRTFGAIYKKIFDKPFEFLLRSSLTLTITMLPPSIIYSLRILMNADFKLCIVCELSAAFLLLLSVCLAASQAIFGNLKTKHLRFISSFLFQFLLSCLTKGAWLIIFVPHLLLSGLIYSKPN